jgi:tetratricopeptide (TPR) repeat protein
LKKIHYFDSQKNYKMVREHLAGIDSSQMNRVEMKEISTQLKTFGDHYFDKGEFNLAREFYYKVLNLNPSQWDIYNKLERINRQEGAITYNFTFVGRQLLEVFNNFKASFLLVNNFINMLFFSGILVFFLFAILLFSRYFTIAGHDFATHERGGFSIKNLAILLVLLFWPAFFFPGWVAYPFLIIGLLWTYINDTEKRAAVLGVILVGILAILFAFNGYMENTYKHPYFTEINNVYEGKLYEDDVTRSFDNEMKVMQAFAYYDEAKYERALDLLVSTEENYGSILKYNLLGNIYFIFDNLDESIKYYKRSLEIDDKNTTTLNNFAMALLKNGNSEVLELYGKRYPELSTYQKTAIGLQVSPVTEIFLWRRLVNGGKESFDIGFLIGHLVNQLVRGPVLYLIVIFFVYIFVVRLVFASTGESTYCSKCSKVIKKKEIHRSYKLCNECYQLFMIKDVIFLEAKIIKEKELKKKFVKRYMGILFLSLFIPGLNLNFKNKNSQFLIFASIFYVFFGFYLVSKFLFEEIFLAVPIFVNLVGLLTLVIYFLVNIYSIIGDDDGV